MNQLVNYLVRLGQSSMLQALSKAELAEHLIKRGCSNDLIEAFISGNRQDLEKLANINSITCNIVKEPDDVPDDDEETEDVPNDDQQKSVKAG